MKTIDIERLNRDNFRAMMNALSMPGSVEKVEPLFESHLLAVANTLLYSEVSFHYDGKEEFELIEAITNSKQTQAEEADYVFSDQINDFLFNKGKVGTPKDPEYSTTFVFKCKDFKGQKVRLSGPGINEKIELTLPVDKSFIEFFNEKNSYYPLGNEVFFLNQNSEIIGITRTTKVEII